MLGRDCRGHIVGHVCNIGHDVNRPITRVYATPLAQPWHNDSVLPNPLVGRLSHRAMHVSAIHSNHGHLHKLGFIHGVSQMEDGKFHQKQSKLSHEFNLCVGRCGGAAVPEAGTRGRPQQLGVLHLHPQRNAEAWQVCLLHLKAALTPLPFLLHLPLIQCKTIYSGRKMQNEKHID